MDQARPSATNTNHAGKERRAHSRHPVSVPVDIMIEGLGQRSAEARDYCPGGLLVVFQPEHALPTDTSVENSLCLITLNISGDDFRMRARIVRADQDSIGVSFINPDQIALKALSHHAEADAQSVMQTTEEAVKEQGPSTNKSSDNKQVTSDQLVQILNACNSKMRSYCEPLLNKFLEQINDKLLQSAKDTDDISIQNTYFKSLEQINNNKNLIKNSFILSVNSELDQNHALKSEDELNNAALDPDESLALISDEAFNVWLANSKVINKIESECPQQLGEIEKRLSYIYEQTVDRRNNPFGPTLFVNSFQSMLEILELDNATKPACYDAFRSILVTFADTIYKEINQILIQHNILPNLKDIVAQGRKTNPQKENSETESENPESTDDNHETSEKESTPREHVSEKQILSESDKLDAQGNASPVTQQSLYELVGEIRNLQQQINTNYSSGHTVTGEPQTGIPENNTQASNNPNIVQMPSYSTAEVLDVIANIAISANNVKGDGQSLAQFRQTLNEKIEASHTETEKSLSLQQGRIIDVTENVFTSLLNDLQVAQSIRPWLEQLAIPVMKMALLDDNIFTDKNHVVRNVINKLAELEVLASAEDKEEQAAVRQAFNWVINLVNKEFDGTTKVYTRAAQQLDLLINVQQQSFEKNIQQVVAEAIHEEEVSSDEASISESKDEQHDKWLRMARRLEENHWVIFEADGDESKRLKVAWVAPRKGKYVFVNVMGRKDRIVTDIKLAEQFQAGTAVVLDGSDDPAMDRAQYSMLQKLHKQLLFQSSHDELTGLVNRREFLKCMQQAVDDAKQSKNKHAICYIDIDDFKVVNTNYGYDAGDKLLHEIVKLFQSNTEENNVLARIGADQFALLLQNTSTDDAVELIEEIMDQIVDYRFEWKEDRLSVTFSSGIALINANVNDTNNLLQTAESSCSIAKESGGNQVQIAHAGSSRLSRRKKDMEWATKIDKALDEDALFLRCQKIAPTQPHLDQRPHYEILLGISDELGGAQSLGDFIQAAEQHNRMAAVDRWVIQTAFEWLAKYEDSITDMSDFSINLSGQSLNNEQLIDFIYQQVNLTSVPIERVCFEVTETAGVTNLSDTADFIETIKGTGCKFSLDDFGTGMSSYSYLKSLPVDYLKIDGIFIKDIANNRNDYAVVKSICEIGHFMEKQVVAEFVQDEKSAAILKEIGVDFLQGYGIAKPHKLDDLLQ